MDWDKIKRNNPKSVNALIEWARQKHNADICSLKFYYVIGMVQEFFELNSIYVWIEKKDDWVIRVDDVTKDNFRYTNSYEAWGVAFEIAFDVMESKEEKGQTYCYTAKETWLDLSDILPERHKKNFNNFNSVLNALRTNKLKYIIFTEGIDWSKIDNKAVYTESGLRKIKEYFFKIKR